ITYQQVQKCEKGANRIGASRLQQISHILQVPVAFFFEDASNALAPHDSSGSALSMAQIDDFVSDSNGLRLMRAFMRIDDAELRRRSVMLLQEIAGDDDWDAAILAAATPAAENLERIENDLLRITDLSGGPEP